MKLSVSTVMRRELKEFGYSKNMPSAFNSEYKPVWDKFLTMAAVKSLLNQIKDTTYKQYVHLFLFVSYIDELEATGYDFANQAERLCLSDIKQSVNRMRDVFARTRLSEFKTIKMAHDIEYSAVELLNTITSVRFHGYVYLTPKNGAFDSTLNSALLRSKSVPEQLKTAHPTTTLLNSNHAYWYNLSDANMGNQNIRIDLARARGNVLLLRYSIKINLILFYGKDLSVVDKRLDKLWIKMFSLT